LIRDTILQVSTAQILKQTLTPMLRRKSFQIDPEIIHRSHSVTELNKDPEETLINKISFGPQLSIPNVRWIKLTYILYVD